MSKGFLSQYLSSNYKDTLPFDFQAAISHCVKTAIFAVSLVGKGQNHDIRKKTFTLGKNKKPSLHRREFPFFPSLVFTANVLAVSRHSFSPTMPGYGASQVVQW